MFDFSARRARRVSRNAAFLMDHAHNAATGSCSRLPSSVRRYSVFGGTTGYTVRSNRPSFSSERRTWISTFFEISGNLSLQLVETAYTPRETIEHDRRPLITDHVKQPARREASVKYFGCVKGFHSEFYNGTGLTPTRAVSAKPPSL